MLPLLVIATALLIPGTASAGGRSCGHIGDQPYPAFVHRPKLLDFGSIMALPGWSRSTCNRAWDTVDATWRRYHRRELPWVWHIGRTTECWLSVTEYPRHQWLLVCDFGGSRYWGPGFRAFGPTTSRPSSEL
jgi:hypothetical protein